jgi:hypothetical protein
MSGPRKRFGRALASGLLLAVAAAAAGCGSSAGGLITGTTTTEIAPDAPGKLSNDHPLARPVAVAWTSARAEKCGFYFDPGKLRASYLAYEAKQSNAEQLAKAQQTYDTTLKLIGQQLASQPDYCNDRKGAEIKGDLQRHLAGDYTPKLPQPKKVESCGLFGCAPAADPNEKWDTEKWWADEAKKRMGR